MYVEPYPKSDSLIKPFFILIWPNFQVGVSQSGSPEMRSKWQLQTIKVPLSVQFIGVGSWDFFTCPVTLNMSTQFCDSQYGVLPTFVSWNSTQMAASKQNGRLSILDMGFFKSFSFIHILWLTRQIYVDHTNWFLGLMFFFKGRRGFSPEDNIVDRHAEDP